MTTTTVRDLMLSLEEYATVGQDQTLRDALVALNKAQLGLTYDRHHHRAVLVLGPGGEVVGKLTHWAILRALEPDLLGAEGVESLERAGIDDQVIAGLRHQLRRVGTTMASMCSAAARVKVRAAMVPVEERIAEEASLSEAIEQMVAGRCQSLLVVRDGKATGIVRISDVFEEVADLIRAE